MKQTHSIVFSQSQNMVLTHAMKQALEVLQMPALELEEWVTREIEENPTLEITSYSSGNRASLDLAATIEDRETVHTLLQRQIISQLPEKEWKNSQQLISLINGEGFLSLAKEELTSQELSLLEKINHFDPFGSGCFDVRHFLLLQLEKAKSADSIAYQIIEKQFAPFLQNDRDAICKKLLLSKSDYARAKRVIQSLKRTPFQDEEQCEIDYIYPEIAIEKVGGKWVIEFLNHLPQFNLSKYYLSLLEKKGGSKTDLKVIKNFVDKGKWLQKIVDKRSSFLFQLVQFLTEKQDLFFTGEMESPIPLTMREAARALELNESTITRGIKNKGIVTPIGTVMLKSLFTKGLKRDDGSSISNDAAKKLILKLVKSENQQKPYSDEKLAELLNAKGIPCARRTISKYRKELNILSSFKRKQMV